MLLLTILTQLVAVIHLPRLRAAVTRPLNIALHAQVAPSEKIVGSVITTDGRKRKLKCMLCAHYDMFF